MSIDLKFSSLVYHSRIKLGLTQKEAAEALSISVRWYQRIESGERFPSSKLLLRMVFLFGINIEELRDEMKLPVLVC